MKKNNFITLIVLLIFNNFSFAKLDEVSEQKIQHYFEILCHDHTSFEPDGAVCERVALREVDSLYPSQNYNIVNGIQYDDNKSTIGELDLVIFNKSTGLVEAIAEVKCWKSFKGGLNKAREQRMRFKTYLNRNIIISDNDDKSYSKELFKDVKKYFTISQEGGLNEGFDFELSLNLKELIELRSRLLDCFALKKCPIN